MSPAMTPTTALTLTILMSVSLLVAPVGHAAGGGNRGGASRTDGPDPDPKQLFQAGLDLLEAGECKQAGRKFKAVLRLEPHDPLANYFSGSALVCRKRHRLAAKFFRRAIKYDRSMYLAHAQLGHIYLELEKFEQANSQLRELTRARRDCANDCPSNLLSAIEELRSAIRPEKDETGDKSEKAPADGK